MRKIKFKAWNKIDNILYIPDEITINNKGNVLGFDGKNIELLQFTGLKDKNGKEIYEGDIVKYSRSFQREENRIIEWSEIDGAYHFSNEEEVGDIICDNCEVIGNKFENPGLLK